MVIARSTKEHIRYVLKAERELPEDQRTTFLLGALPNTIALSLMEMATQERSKSFIELAVYAGLRGWERFLDESGKETTFQREANITRTIHGVEVKGPISKSTYELIPWTVLTELATAIFQGNQLTVDDAKN